jgi:hypothetical protein
VVNGPVLKPPGDSHRMRFKPKSQSASREFVAHDFIDWPPFLHCSGGRDLSFYHGFQRGLTIRSINDEHDIHLPMGVVLFDDVGLLSLSHRFPQFVGPGPVPGATGKSARPRLLASAPIRSSGGAANHHPARYSRSSRQARWTGLFLSM